MEKATKKAKSGGRAFKRVLKGAALVATAYGAKKLYDATRKASKKEDK